MTIGNRTATPRAIVFLGKYITIPPMGIVHLPDDKRHTEELERLKKNATFRTLLDTNVIVVNTAINQHATPVVPEAPQPPQELLAEPENERVKRGRAKKTKETMQV